MNKTRFTALTGMVAAAAASRLLPHAPDFTPIAALALFGGAQFADKRAAFLVPMLAMFASDLVIGLHPLMPFVYGSFAVLVCLGFWLRREPSVGKVAVAGILGAVLFFLIANFGFWACFHLYPKTPGGLLSCYVAAIPFFRNSLLGTLIYCAVLFGGLALAEQRFARVRRPEAAPFAA